MRAVLTLDEPRNQENNHLENLDIWEIFKEWGLEPSDMPTKTDENEVITFFKEHSKAFLSKMPNLRKHKEEGSIIYSSFLPKTRSDFIVTRTVKGTLTIRILNTHIEDLKNATEHFLNKVWSWNKDNKDKKFLPYQDIKIYEADLEESTIKGQIIDNPYNYAKLNDSRNLTIAIWTISIFIGLSVLLYLADFNSEAKGHIERFATAMLTASTVSFLSFFNNYFIIKKHSPIKWGVLRDIDLLE